MGRLFDIKVVHDRDTGMTGLRYGHDGSKNTGVTGLRIRVVGAS